GQTNLVDVVDDELGHRHLAGAEFDVAERIFHFADLADGKTFADDYDAPAIAAKLVVHIVGELLQRAGAFRQVNLQRHLAARIGQAGGGGDEADLAAHGLHHQHRVGGRAAGVFFVVPFD